MILDATLRFAREQALSGGTAATDVIDLVKGGNALACEPVVTIHMAEAAAGGTKAVFELQTSDSEAFTSPDTLWRSGEVLTAKMGKGAEVAAFRIPRGAKRYVRGYVTVTGTFTAGRFDMFVVSSEPRSYHDL